MPEACDFCDEGLWDELMQLVHVTEGECLKEKDDYGYLPVHLACIGESGEAPPEVLMKMVHAFPGSLKVRDKDGRLPVHNAVIMSHDRSGDVVKAMLTVWPESLEEKTKDGHTLLDLDWLPDHHQDKIRKAVQEWLASRPAVTMCVDRSGC